MPGITAPTYYERSKGFAHEKYDTFFKWCLQDTAEVESTGSVEAPVGYVALVRVDHDLMAVWFSEPENRGYEYPSLDMHGWYIVRTDNNGLVWGIDYGGSGTHSEELARADFAEARELFSNWLELED